MASFRFFSLQIEANGNSWRYVLSEAHAVEAERDWRRKGAKVTKEPIPEIVGAVDHAHARRVASVRVLEHVADPRQTNAPAGGTFRGARTGDRLNCQGETATASRSKHAKRRTSTKAKG